MKDYAHPPSEQVPPDPTTPAPLPKDPYEWADSAVGGKHTAEPDFSPGISSPALLLAPASQLRRVFAFFVDLSFAFAPFVFVASSPVDSASTFIAALVGCAYFTTRDVFAGRGIGKRLFGLRVVDATTAAPCAPLQSLKRNGLPVFSVGAALIGSYLLSFVVGNDIAGAAGGVTALVAWIAPFAGFGSGRFRTLCDAVAKTYVVNNHTWSSAMLGIMAD